MKCKRLPIKYLSPRLQNPGSLSCQMAFLDNDSFSKGSDLVVMAIGHSYKLGHRMVFKALSIFNFEKVCKLLQNTIFMCSVCVQLDFLRDHAHEARLFFRLESPNSLTCQMGIFHVDNFSGGSDRSVMALGHSYQLGQRTIIKGMQNLRFEKVEFFFAS